MLSKRTTHYSLSERIATLGIYRKLIGRKFPTSTCSLIHRHAKTFLMLGYSEVVRKVAEHEAPSYGSVAGR